MTTDKQVDVPRTRDQGSDKNTDSCKHKAEICQAYDGSTTMFKLLRAAGWGPLVNMGYYSPFKPALWLSVPAVQTDLVRRTLALGGLKPGDRILDVACGRGKSSYMMSCAAGPLGSVVGLDLLPQNVSTAAWLYGSQEPGGNLSYVEGDANALDSHPAVVALSPNLIYCIEAAFHFDRPAFLASAARALAPGGRLVVVDFAWREKDAAGVRAGKVAPDAVNATRDVWQFTDFSTESEYRKMAAQAGFVVKEVQDWSTNVLTANTGVLGTAIALSRSTAGRALLRVIYPDMLLTDQEWADLDRCVTLQIEFMRHVRYMAYVFERAA